MNEFDIEDLLIIEKEAFFPLTIGTSFNIQLKNKYSKYMVAEKSYVKPLDSSDYPLFNNTAMVDKISTSCQRSIGLCRGLVPG
jgi:hypothetical protein